MFNVAIGPFEDLWIKGRIQAYYTGSNFVTTKDVALDPTRILRVYKQNCSYYFIYETNNEFYLQYATTIPQGAKEVKTLEVPCCCEFEGKYVYDEDICAEAYEDGAIYIYKEWISPNIEVTNVITEYRPYITNQEAMFKYLTSQGKNASMYVRVVRRLNDDNVIGYESIRMYDEAYPHVGELAVYKEYKTPNGNVYVLEKQLSRGEAKKIAEETGDPFLEAKYGIIDTKTIMIPEYFIALHPKKADELMRHIIKYMEEHNKIIYMNEATLNEVSNDLRKKYMELYNKIEEKERQEEEEKRKRIEEELQRERIEKEKKIREEVEALDKELGRFNATAVSEGNMIIAVAKGYLKRDVFNEYITFLKHHGFKFDPRRKVWYKYVI